MNGPSQYRKSGSGRRGRDARKQLGSPEPRDRDARQHLGPVGRSVPKATKLGAHAAEYVPPPPPLAHLWTDNGYVEVAEIPGVKPMDVDHAGGPSPELGFTCTGSPRLPEHADAPMEWMSFVRWLQCYRRPTEAPYRNMGREQVRACWVETCANADKVGHCRANPGGGLEVLLSNRMVCVPVFHV